MRERGAGSGLSPAAVRETTALPRPPRPANSEHDVKPDLDKSLLVSAQYVSEGNGGIAEVARLTAKSLGRQFSTRALACLDDDDFRFEDVCVRGFGGGRLKFVASLIGAARTATHIVHDFVGTARAQSLIFPRRPYAVWAHGIEVWDNPRPSHLKALRRADLVLVNSAYTLERASEALQGARNVRLCRLGTTSDDAPDHVGPSPGPPTVLLLGRIDPSFPKGHALLISMWPLVVAAVPNARLLFAGGGPALAQARDLAARSPAASSIEVAGFVPAQDLETIWRRATVFAMPSYEEGFGLVFIEAMRRGIPVIASREDAGQEINLDGATGYNLTRDEPERHAAVALANKIARTCWAILSTGEHFREELYTRA